MKNKSRIFSILKAITWKIIGSLDTIDISYFFTQNTVLAFSIGGVEVITKSFLFYIHSRIWLRLIKKIDNSTIVTNSQFSKTTNIFALENWKINSTLKEKRLN